MHVSRYVIYQEIDQDRAIIASSLTGAVDLLDAKGKTAWQAAAASGNGRISGKLAERLKKRGYLYDSPEDEALLFDRMWGAYDSSRPGHSLRFAVCPTYQCNLACIYCYEGQLPQTSFTTLEPSDAGALFRAIDAIAASRHKDRASIELTGGEPLLPKNRPLVEKIFAAARERGYVVGAVTNGSCLASHFADLFQEYASSLAFVQVTLDGPPEVHNQRRPYRGGKETFDVIVSTIDFLLRRGMPARLRVNIDAQNVAALPRLADYISSRGWLDSGATLQCELAPVLDHKGNSTYCNMMPEAELLEALAGVMKESALTKDTFRTQPFRVLGHISSLLGGRKGSPGPCFQYCEANSPNFFVFGADGLIYPCGEAIGNREMAIGRFLPEYESWPDREQVWRGRSISNIPECRECDVAGFCGGGCTYSALARHGTAQAAVCSNAHQVLEHYCRSLVE